MGTGGLIAAELAAEFRQHRAFAISMRGLAARHRATAFTFTVRRHRERRVADESQQKCQNYQSL
jgi:hypothetical protein